MNFEEYLTGKKIDSNAFRQHDEKLWNEWKAEFEQMHPKSFTMQKLNLINPIRRKFLLKEEIPTSTSAIEDQTSGLNPQLPLKPSPPKPVFKPKPKIS